MAFLLGGVESVLAFGEKEIGNIASSAIPYFEKRAEQVASNVVASGINTISKSSSQNSFINQTLSKLEQKRRMNHPVKKGRKARRT